MARPPRPTAATVTALARPALISLFLAASCDGGGGEGGDTGTSIPDCTDVDLQLDSCSLAFQPTFDNVFDQVLGATCGQAGGACHGQADALGAANGLQLTDIDDAHDALVAGGFVTPGDAACSEVVVRLESDDPLVVMPPGATPLDPNVRCSIETWIQEGAQR